MGATSPVERAAHGEQGEDGGRAAQRQRIGQAPFPQVDEDERHEEGGGDGVDRELTVAPGGVGQTDEDDGDDGEHDVAPLTLERPARTPRRRSSAMASWRGARRSRRPTRRSMTPGERAARNDKLPARPWAAPASAASAAARITARGASRPVQSSSWRAPWWTSMPSPSTIRHPCAAAAASRGVRSGWYTRSATTWPARRSRRVHRQRAVVAHAERRGLHQEVGAADVLRLAGGPRSPASGGRGLAAAGRAVHHHDLPAARVGQRPHHGPGRPARAEHHRGHPRRVDAVVEPERVEEALAVGALAPEPAVRRHDDGVGRAERLDSGAALVDQGGDVGLVGHRHGEPGQAERPDRVQRAAGAAGRHLEGDVAPVQAARREGGVVHRGREAVGDGRSDDAGHPRPAADRQDRECRRRGPAHPSSPAARAFATFFRWSSYVVAKAWRPLLSAST